MFLRHASQFVALAAIVLTLAAPAPARALETPARHMILMDADTGDTLAEKEADVQMPPASMLKLMTLDLLFGAIHDGTHKLDDSFLVSEKAWRMGGSKMFVEVGKQVTIRDLIFGIIVHSGNDACIVVAEGLAGSEDAFAGMMNARAKEIGLTNSNFTNSTGWPDPAQYVTARDLAMLARHMIVAYPELYALFNERSFTYSGITQSNRNPLLGTFEGADGLKTGHTEEAGYGLVASAKQGDRRLVLVVSGLDSMAQRKEESTRLMDVGFKAYQRYDIYKPGDLVSDASVWLGAAPRVPLVVNQPVRVYLTPATRKKLETKVTYSGPVPAPIAAGDAIGTLTLEVPGEFQRTVPLYAGRAVGGAGIGGRISSSLNYFIQGSPKPE